MRSLTFGTSLGHVVGSTLLVAALACSAASCGSAGEPAPMPSTYGAELYVENCAPCHGTHGYGDGPAALALGVQPRNLRLEEFRYVSVPGGPATTDDLVATILGGRRLGAMPAFPYLTHQEARQLAEYVRELRRLGLMETFAKEFAAEGDDVSHEELEEISRDRVEPDEPVAIEWPGRDFRPDTELGRALYAESCASCHGASGRGDGLDLPVDDLGNPIVVRDLTTGEFRGGSSPAELYLRIRCGVPGTPMPESDALSGEEIFQLIHYVRLLAGMR